MLHRSYDLIALALIGMYSLLCAPAVRAADSDIVLLMPALAAARGEIESVEFTIVSPTTRENLNISHGDFFSGSKIISSSALDVKVVAAWYQSERAAYDVHRAP